jgi:glycosyltransferase involved in cell wall biosynthesis
LKDRLWPDVTVLIITWNRPVEIRHTIYALRRRLVYPGTLRWHIADDHSPEGYLPAIQADFPDITFMATQTDRKGWGANVNLALSAIHTDYVFSCEDDYVATRDIDLGKGVELMELRPDVGLVRYDGLSGHIGLDLSLQEAKKFDKLNYLVIVKDKSSHLNVYSNRPHLKHARFHNVYGMYKEGVTLGECETDFAFRVKNNASGQQLAILDDGIPRAFEHIGKSRQLTDMDPGQGNGRIE